MNKVYLTILNFYGGKVYQYQIDEEVANDHEVTEQFMVEEGFSLDNIQWMTHENESVIKMQKLCMK